MAETHVLHALKNRREELTAEIRTLSEAITHLDATIRLFEAGKPPKAMQRQLSRAVFQALHEAGRPLTAKEIAEAVDAPVKRVMGTLCYQRDKGRVITQRMNGRSLSWTLEN